MGNAATAKTNGKPATEEKAVMEVVKSEPVQTAQVQPAPKAENKVLSLEKRIQKVAELNILIDKWKKLNESRQNLNEFKLGNDGLSNHIVIRDAAGKEFKTNQPAVFNMVVKSVQELIDEKIAETEALINFAD